MIHEMRTLKMSGSMEYARYETYLLSHSKEIPIDERPLVIICPGGGYCMTSEREAEMFAIKWNSYGFHAIVVWYSVAPAEYPTALFELAETVKTARRNAKLWHIDPDRIFIQGSSAGGHLAANFCTSWKETFLREAVEAKPEELRPNGMILNYPVITSGEYAHHDSFRFLLGERYEKLKDELSIEKCVNADTPPAFIWHTWEDDCVPVENSLLLASALKNAGIPTELHIYMKGHHGLGLANELTAAMDFDAVEPECQSWFELAYAWTKEI